MAHSDLVAGKLDSQILDPIFQQIGIKLQRGGAYFVQQGQKAQDY